MLNQSPAHTASGAEHSLEQEAANAPEKTALEFRGVTHSYGKGEVTRNVSFSLKKNEIICILGPSGCGKTTLLRLASGLEQLGSGQILVDDKIVSDSEARKFTPPEKRHIGLMFQDLALFPHLTVMQNILFGINKKFSVTRKHWVTQMMERLGIGDKGDNYPHALSGGERQRVALVRALAPRPSVLFLDEPFSSLDANRRLQMREDTVHLLKDEKMAAMMVTHDPEEALFMADRIIIMKEGEIIQIGSAQEVFMHPRNAFVVGLFGPTNRFETVVLRGTVNTPVGVFKTELEHGTKVEVLIRPEAITPLPKHLQSAEKDSKPFHDDFITEAEVTVSHFLGRSTCLHIAVDEDQKDEIRARAPLHNSPEIGMRESFRIDPAHVFIFPIF